MRPSFPSKGRRPPWSTAKHKYLSPRSSTTLPDLLSTSLLALKESADAFPPLKSAVSGVLVVWDIAQRAKHCKSDARAIALRTKDILDVIADAVPDGSTIPEPMLQSIRRFTLLLEEIGVSIESIVLARGLSHVMNLNRNERALQGIQSRLDDSYRDFIAASALRMEVQQAKIVLQQADIAVEQKQLVSEHRQFANQQTDTQLAVSKVVDTLATDLSSVLFYSRFSVFLASP